MIEHLEACRQVHRAIRHASGPQLHRRIPRARHEPPATGAWRIRTRHKKTHSARLTFHPERAKRRYHRVLLSCQADTRSEWSNYIQINTLALYMSSNQPTQIPVNEVIEARNIGNFSILGHTASTNWIGIRGRKRPPGGDPDIATCHGTGVKVQHLHGCVTRTSANGCTMRCRHCDSGEALAMGRK